MTHARRPADSQPSVSEELTAIHPAGIAGDTFVFPLSPAQAKMWLADRARPGNPAYNASFRWRLTGPLDVRILSRALNEIVRRHEILRASFTEIDGNPVQIIAPPIVLNIPVKDLCTLTSADRETQMDRLCLEEATRSFDLEKGPLVRLGLLRMADEDHILMFTLHHIVSDGWSIGLIMEELKNIYTAYAEGRESPLPELPIQYPDYVIWQQGLLDEPDSVKQGEYWKKKLSGYERLEVQTDFPRPADSTTHSAIVSQMLPRELTDAVKEFSNSYGGTMFITTLAACMTLLARYTGKHDIAVGSPLAGRNRTELESLVGLFVNHIVFRSDASGNPAFPEFTARVRDAALEAFANQDVPFENVLKSLSHDGKAAAEPFHLVNFICQREYARASTFVFEFAGIRMSTMPSKSQGALYDLNFFMVEREAGWRLSLEYKTDLYSDKTAQQMLGDFRGLLEAIASNPDRRLSEFSMSERAKPAAIAPADDASSSQSATGEIYVMPASVAQERFWLLANFFPGNPAFNMPACVRLTGNISEQLLEKSFQVLIDRHETLRTTFEVVNDELTQIISPASTFSLPVVVLPSFAEAGREAKLEEVIREEAQRPFDLVRGPVFRARLFRLGAEDNVLVVTIHHILADGWSHNVFQRELWTAYEALSENREPPLGPLAIQYSDFTAWQREWLASAEARDHLEFWTKVLSSPLPVLDYPTDRPPSSRPASRGALETLLLSRDLVDALKAASKTENVTMFTLMLTCFAILLSRGAGQENLIIGSPIANRRPETEALIGPFAGPMALRLNLCGNPTLREATQRVQAVILDALGHCDLPFETLLQSLNVRSVRGRNALFQFYFSYQVAFLQPRQVNDLAVSPLPTFSTGTPFEMQLAAIERAEGVRIQLDYNPDLFDSSSIRLILQDYRRILEAMAKNPGGSVLEIAVSVSSKVPSASHPDASEAEITAPRNETERKLAKIWKEVLGIQRVGLHQNYFELGGTSLLAVHLFSEIEKAFNVKLPLSTLFTAQTVAELAPIVSNRAKTNWSPLVHIQPGSSRPTLFCAHGAGGNVLIYRALARHLGPEQPVCGLQCQGLDGKRAYLTRVEDMATLYVNEIRKTQPHGPYFLGGYCMGGTIAFEMARQLNALGEEIALVALFDAINWSKLGSNSIWVRIHRKGEKLMFHAGNFLLLDFKDKVKFWREKLTELRSRVHVWRGKLLGNLIRHRDGAQSESRLLAEIWDSNDRAALAYVPRPYPGTVTDFRPMKQYSSYIGPDKNWDQLALGGQEIVTLPVYPAGMLVEPFVQRLAAALTAAIDRAIQRNRSLTNAPEEKAALGRSPNGSVAKS
jgi:non-ribosomal peptide synthetase component F/thioesterase domain-containing protein